MAQGMIGLGISLQMANVATPLVRTNITDVSHIGAAPMAKFDQVDISTYDQGSVFRQYIPGLADPGDFSFDMNFIPNSATDIFLRGKQGQTQLLFITFPNGATSSFQAVITEYGADKLPIEGKLSASCKCKVSGAVTWGAATAPVNLVPPSIAATALTVGSVLTADVGIWSPGGTSYSYQWRKNAVNIAGAINPTYTTVAADVASGIDVQVTATNATGSTTVGSVKTGNIV